MILIVLGSSNNEAQRVFSGSFGSANILRQRKWEASRPNVPFGRGGQRANQPPVSDALFLREEDIGAVTT
tara:strand:+ start:126098 stop:126307 length:210 start_codon:yes stop_codon:yes gene_type:complete